MAKPDNSSLTSISAATVAVNPGSNVDENGTETHDGLLELEAESLLRFPEDNRMHEVCRILRSSKPIYIKVDRSADVSDLDHRAKLLEKLSLHLRRSFAYPVGRGMLTIASAEPLMAEKLPIPPLCIQGRVPPNNSIISADNLADSVIWPEFHNGVAAALRVGPKLVGSWSRTNVGSDETNGSHYQRHDARYQRLHGMRSVTRNWIMYNKTASQINSQGDNSHAGTLMLQKSLQTVPLHV